MSVSTPGRRRSIRRVRLVLASVLAAASAACGVSGRDSLIGRYVVPSTGEAWTLRDDGTCTSERAGAVLACEWEYRERKGETRLVVTAAGSEDSARRHRRQYVLTPSKWPGRPVTIPLSASATLEKRDGVPGGDATP
jgi:hypothetical protein